MAAKVRADLLLAGQACLARLCAEHPLSRPPILIWKALRVSAGIANYRRWTITLSTSVLTTEKSVEETLVHEYAHLLAVDRCGPKAASHGKPWVLAMQELGAEPKIHHSFQVCRNAKRQVVRYQCARCSQVLERSRRLPKGRRYNHVGCGGEVRLVQIVSKNDQIKGG